MLTEPESLELYLCNWKINKIWFISISLLWLDSKKPKMASVVLSLELLIYVCKVNGVASKDFELLSSQRKSEMVFQLFIYKMNIVV